MVPGAVESGITDSILANLPGDTDWKKMANLMPSLEHGAFGNPDHIAGAVAILVSDGGAHNGPRLKAHPSFPSTAYRRRLVFVTADNLSKNPL